MSCSPSLSRRQLVALLAAFGVAPEAVEAQDAVKIDPRNYRVVFENAKVRVLDYASQPGSGVCGIGKHWHPAHVTVQMTPVKVRVTGADSKAQVIDVPAGAIFFEPAVTHTTENLGGSGAHAYVIELKDASWKPATGTT
jgi:beta-alanine degradation protein BauB